MKSRNKKLGIAAGIKLILLAAFLSPACHSFGAENTGNPLALRSMDNGPFPPDIKKIKERGKLIVAQYKKQRPLFYMFVPKDDKQIPDDDKFTMPNGQVVAGMDIGLAVFLAKVLRVRLEIDRSYETFSDVIFAVANGKADLGISKLGTTFPRLQVVKFSKPYAKFSFALLVNRQMLMRRGLTINEKSSGNDFDKAFNLPEIKIGVQEYSSYAEEVDLIFPKAKILTFKHHEDLADAIREGKVDAGISDDFEFRFMFIVDPELKLYCEVYPIPNSPYNIAVATNTDSDALMDIVNETINFVDVLDAAAILKKEGSLLKGLYTGQDLSASKADISSVFDSGILNKKEKEPGMPGRKNYGDRAPVEVLVLVGAALAGLVAIWMRMSRKRSQA